MARTLVAGVDSSTQSCKVVVCDAATGEVVRSARAAHPDGTEVHPDRWWEAFQDAVAGGLLDDVQAISVGGQQHGMCVLDEDDAVVRPALLWNDPRSAGVAADLVDELGGPQAWAQTIGVVPVAAITATKLRWLAQHEPDLCARVRTCVLPHDWLTGELLRTSGGFTGWTTDRGDASGTGYWSAADESYHPDLLELAVGRPLEVPTVLAPDAAAGRTRDGMLVAAGTGDNMAAALGLGLEPGDVVLSLGTSGTAFARHLSPSVDPLGEVASFADAAGGFLPLVCTLNAARVLTAGATMLGTDLAGLDALALQSEVGAGGLTLLPYLDGERTPNLPGATGTLAGLTRGSMTPANVARAVVEGMLLNVAAGVDSLRRVGVPVERVHLIGGAAGSAAVRQVAASLLGVPVVIPAPGEYVAIGAAKQAAWALQGGSLPSWSLQREDELPAGHDPAAHEAGARFDALREQLHGVQSR